MAYDPVTSGEADANSPADATLWGKVKGNFDDHESRIANILSGTVMVFHQASAPTGWTKSTAHNNKALRVVSGSGGGSGGTYGFASISAQSGGGHNHSTDSSGVWNAAGSSGIVAVGGHTHTIDPLYIDVIVASRD